MITSIGLSACETGLGKLAKGEVIIGLIRALLYAGARTVAASLWQVSDQFTAQLMQHFYQHLLSKKGKAQALRKVKLKLLKKKAYTKPYYWAPFILIGC